MRENFTKAKSILLIGIVMAITIVFACFLSVPLADSRSDMVTSMAADPIVTDSKVIMPTTGISGKLNIVITDYSLSGIKLVDSVDEGIEYIIDTVTVGTLPTGLSYEGSSMTISGTPTEAFNGSVDVTVAGEGHQAVGSFSCYVENTIIDSTQISIDKTEYDYTGNNIMPIIVVNNDLSLPLNEGTDYSLSYTRNGASTTDFVSVGTIDVQVTMISPYSGSHNLSYSIKYAGSDDLTFTDMLKPIVASYDTRFDEVVVNGLKVWKDGVRQNIASINLMNPTDLPNGITYSNYALRGRAMEVITTRTLKFLLKTTANDYKEFTVPITINRQTLLSNNISIEYLTTYYNAVERKPNVTVKDAEGRQLTANVDYYVSFKRDGNIATDFVNITGQGGIAVEIDGMGNYQGKHFRSYSILPKIMDESYLKDFQDAHYTGLSQVPTVLFDNYSATEHDIFMYRGDRICVDFINAGTIRVEVIFKGNYSGRVSKVYTILPVVADPADIRIPPDVIYDGTAKSPKVDINKWVEGRDYNIKYYRNDAPTVDFTHAGAIKIVVTFINNTSGEYTFKYTILPKSITDIQLSLGGNIVYTGNDILPSVYVNTVYQRHVDYDIIYYRNGKVTEDIKNVGVITVKVVMKGNYSGEQSADYSILYSMMNVTGQDNLSAKISSSSGFDLNTTFTISMLENHSFNLRLNAGEEIKMIINVKMLLGEVEGDLANKATLRLKPNFDANNTENIRIEYIDKGEQTSKRAVVDTAGYLTFDIYSVGEIVIIAKVQAESTLPWWTWIAVAGGAFVLLMAIVLIIYISYRNNGIRTIMPKRRR